MLYTQKQKRKKMKEPKKMFVLNFSQLFVQ